MSRKHKHVIYESKGYKCRCGYSLQLWKRNPQITCDQELTERMFANALAGNPVVSLTAAPTTGPLFSMFVKAGASERLAG